MKRKNLKQLAKNLAFITVMIMSIKLSNAQTLTYKWAAKAGSTSTEEAHSVTTDASGNVYTTGMFSGTIDMDPSSSTYNLTSNGETDVYVCKFSSAGTLIWAIKIGGSYSDNAKSIALDGSGNVFVTGAYMGTVDFDPSTDSTKFTAVPNVTVINKTFIGNRTDIFILKLNNAGEFVWAKTLGAGGDDVGNAIAVDSSNNVIVTGIWSDLNEEFDTADFNPGTDVFNLTGGGSFVLKLNNSGDFSWACGLGRNKTKNKIIYTNDYGYFQQTPTATCKSVITDASGKIFIAGEFQKGDVFSSATDFDPAASSSYNLTPKGNLDAFIWVINANGTFSMAKKFGDISTIAGYASAYDIAVDASGNIYTTGYFRGEIDFDPGSSSYVIKSFGYSKNTNYTNDMFVCKLNSSGNFVWAHQIGGQSDDIGYGIDIAANGNIYFTGHFTGKADFNPSRSTYYLTAKGNQDAFVLKIDASGTFKFAYQIGGTGGDRGLDIVLSGTSTTEIHTCGYFSNTVDMDPGTATVNFTSIGNNDAFVQKITESTSFSKRTLGEKYIKGIECHIYPNPASQIMNVELGKIYETGNVSIMNIEGAVIMEDFINNQQSTVIQINEIPAGIYFIRITAPDLNKTIKFLKY